MTISADAISTLIAQAKSVISAKEGEEFINAVSGYVEAFSAFEATITKIPPENLQIDASLKSSFVELSTLHAQVLKTAQNNLSDVAKQMSELHQKAKGIKQYLDSFPEKVSLTGERKG